MQGLDGREKSLGGMSWKIKGPKRDALFNYHGAPGSI